MATTLVDIKEVYNETIADITSDSRKWQSFLSCASKNYKYDFDEQLLIYAQRPTAVACASYDVWNSKLNRIIKKGHSGIALITEKYGKPSIRYVWDVSDTQSMYGKKGKKVRVWNVGIAYQDQVIEALENKYGDLTNKESFIDGLKSVATILAEDNSNDYIDYLINNKVNTRLENIDNDVIISKYKNLLKNSVAYMLINKCVGNAENNFLYTDFNDIVMFQDIDNIVSLGSAISDISEMTLLEIYETLKNIRVNEIEKIRTFDKNNNKVYDVDVKEERSDSNDNLQRSGILQNTEPKSETKEIQHRQIWSNEIGLSEEREESVIRANEDQGYTSRTPIGDRFNGNEESKFDIERDDDEGTNNRGIEREKSNEVDRIDEQFEESSRRNSNERVDSKLDENTNNSILFLASKENGVSEIITNINELEDNKSYTVARVMNKINAVELHYINGIPTVELGTRRNEDTWDNEIVDADWFNKNLSNEDVIKKLEEIFNDEFSDVMYLYDKNDGEIGLLYDTLNKYKINDIELMYDDNGNLLAMDDENIWHSSEFYKFLFDEVFTYDNNIPNLIEEKDYQRLKEYASKYKDEKDIIPPEKEIIVLPRDSKSQLSLFATKEQEFADRMLELLNESSEGTIWEDSFYIKKVELEKWNHIKSNKRHLTILLDSKNITNYDTNFTYFNTDKTNEIKLREQLSNNKLFKYLSKDKDFSITLNPTTIFVIFQNFDSKNYDLSIGKDEVLENIKDNVQIIDDLEDKPLTVSVKREKEIGYILHPEVPLEDRINYKITNNNIGVGTPKERFRNNINAIRVLKTCEQENRYAIKEEQEILSNYVGWGGLSNAFDPDKWSNEYDELKSLLTEEEYRQAKESTLTAFYTPPIVIKAMFKALNNMGLEKGNILEPGCGIGNFIGLLPNNDKLKIYGVEKDIISGNIARQLYQKSSITVKGFEEVNYSNSFFDVAIGNVPFANIQLNDKKYNLKNFLIHDYFFAKAIDKVRPGGILAFITSQGFMDRKNEDARKYIASRADLIGAIRLPNNVFKDSAGTTVTSDILFLQKRDSITDIMPDWINLDTDENGMRMNKYFIDNPEMILGEMKLLSTQYGTYEPSCVPKENMNLEKMLDKVIPNINGEIKDYKIDDIADSEDLSIEADLNVKNFSYTIINNVIYYRENSRMYSQSLSETAENRIKNLINLRDITREIINLQLENATDDEIKEKQKELNSLYDKFTKKYGFINSRGNASAFSNDSSYFLLCSLEILDESGNLKRKADLFTKRTIKPRTKDRIIENSRDALIVSIQERAKVDIDYMQKLCGLDKDKMLEELEGEVFKVPDSDNSNHYVTADEYLSGNVREKLKIAKQYAYEDSSYQINVEYLNKVIPKDIPPTEISVRIGATWIPEDVITEFILDLIDAGYYARRDVKAHYSDVTGEWNIANKSCDRNTIAVTSTYGTNRANAYRLIEDALNLRDTKIFDYVYDEENKKKPVLNKKETAIAQAKQDKIKQVFQDWIWQDQDRRERLTRIYNEKFNSVIPREYDGSHITFDGINPEITLRPHQVNAIARVLYGGNTLLAHEVGAGKTFEMVASAMESKRLGLCNKSLFVVPNHIIEQFASEFLQLYPSANILVATKKDFETANRKKFCSRIATGEYDAVIIGHSQFEKIPMSVKRQITLLEQQLDDTLKGIQDLKEHNGERFSIKALVRTQKSIEKKLQQLNNADRKDDVITFEELGVDRLFVDEAHYYKNLFLYTKMRNVGGIAQTEAQKSSDLFMKCRYLDEITGGKGIVFATGTPISNSMVELYTMQRYLQYDKLVKSKLQHFDAWASTFGETVTAIELAPEGTGYRTKTRFAKFYNLPELMNLFKEVADIQTSDTLNLPLPKANYENIVIKPSQTQLDLVNSLGERAEKVRNKAVDSREDNMLKITNEGRKIALDQRLINELLPDYKDSKVEKCSENIYKIWNDTKEDKLAQLVFCDLSTPKGDGTFDVYTDLKRKLIDKGIPEEEIEFIHNANTELKKKELFAKVRAGNVRILMGSTVKMGAGTNCQDKLIALHDLDCPWRPSDLIQRSGRIIRQGNQNKEVYIYRYVTEKTFDAYLYQLVENKQKFISQIMTSKTPMRSAEDIDEVALSYAEIKALAAGNPLIIEKTELDTQVSKLKLLKQSYLNEQYDLESRIKKSYPAQIKELESNIGNYKKDIEFLKEYEKEDNVFYGMTINNILYDEKQKAGEMLISECKKTITDESKIIGEYKEFEMELKFSSFFKEYNLILRKNSVVSINLGTSELGNITRIDNALNNIPALLIKSEEELIITKEQLEKAKEEFGKPFIQEEELKNKTKRLNEVNTLLNMNEKTRELIDDENEEIKEPNQMYKRTIER
jgi:N12 class adenine-specific DNA methylase